MASIQKRPDGRYRARYRDEAEKEHSRHFKRKSDAQRWLDEVTASVVRGDYVAPSAGDESCKPSLSGGSRCNRCDRPRPMATTRI